MGKQTDPFYSTGAWRQARALALIRDGGDCVYCRRAGRYALDKNGRRVPVRAALVHHEKPLKEYPALALDLSNLTSLCLDCHAAAHPEKGGREAPPTAAQRLGIRFEKL